MDYLLPGILILGVLLFVIGWIKVILGGFRHHAVTGLVALLPVVNLVTLPAVWHRAGKSVLLGFVGVLLAAGAWFMGAEPKVNKLTAKFGFTLTDNVAETSGPAVDAAADASAESQPVTYTFDLPSQTDTAAKQSETAANVEAEPAAPEPAKRESALPANALYHMVFEAVAPDNLATAIGQYVRISQKDGRTREGKLQAVDEGLIQLEERLEGGTITRSIRLNDVREVALMVKRQRKGD